MCRSDCRYVRSTESYRSQRCDRSCDRPLLVASRTIRASGAQTKRLRAGTGGDRMKSVFGSRAALVIVSAIAGAAMAGGVSVAMATGGSPTISACKNKTTGALHVRTKASPCTATESPLSWNKQGPPATLEGAAVFNGGPGWVSVPPSTNVLIPWDSVSYDTRGCSTPRRQRGSPSRPVAYMSSRGRCCGTAAQRAIATLSFSSTAIRSDGHSTSLSTTSRRTGCPSAPASR